MSRAPWRARLRVADVVQGAAASLRARSLRAVLSALGVAIGIGSGVAILGISASSQADLLAQLGADGSVLTVSAGTAFDGSAEPLPTTAEGMIGLIPPVQSVTSIGSIPGVTVRRTAVVPEIDTGGVSLLAVQASLLKTLGGSVARGTFLNSATEHYPAVVLGAVAAQSLGIDRVPAGTQVDLGAGTSASSGYCARFRWLPRLTSQQWSDSRSPIRCLALEAIRPRSTCAWIPIRCRQLRTYCPSLRTHLSQGQFR